MRNQSTWMAAALLGLLIARSATGTEPAPLKAPLESAELDRTINQHMDETGVIGLGAAIILDGQLVWSKGYGFADKQTAVPFTTDTVMNIGSISKTFTGVALMQAVQDRKLDLDQDINSYLPFKVINPTFPNSPITLRQLATHTSGITDRWEIYKNTYHWGGDARESLGDFLRSYFVPGGSTYSKDNFLPFKPGTHRDYSNIAASLAGYIVELAVGEPLNVYTQQHIFKPLQMNHSGWLLSEVPAGTHSTLYVVQEDQSIPIPVYGLVTYPDGGVRTSVNDLSRFFIALLEGGQYQGTRILDAPTVAEMLRFQYTDENKPDNVQLTEKNSGIFWSTKFDITRVGHGGSDPGVRTEMLSNLSKDVAVILMVNTSLSGADAKAYGVIWNELWDQAEALNRQAKQKIAP